MKLFIPVDCNVLNREGPLYRILHAVSIMFSIERFSCIEYLIYVQIMPLEWSLYVMYI